MSFDIKRAAIQDKALKAATLTYVLTATNAPASEIIRYGESFNKWSGGLAMAVGDFFKYDYDENGYVKIYRVKIGGTSQANIPPGSQYASNVYELVGYIDGTRLWARPLARYEAYQIGAIACDSDGVKYQNTMADNMFFPFGWETVN